jgi:uncharacterized protein YndB with AHSA1/START domain
MSSHAVLVEQSQPVAAPAERVWSLLSRPEAMALRPKSFAFDVAAPPAATLRMVLSVPSGLPFWVAYEVREEVPRQVLSLAVPGRPPGDEEVLTLSAVPDGANSRVATQIRSDAKTPRGQAVIADYWQQTLPQWLAGIRDVAEGIFLGLIAAWMVVNTVIIHIVLGGKAFDPYPYIALNLVLSALAGIQAPIIMMSQNRAAVRDEALAQHHYEETQKIDQLLQANMDMTQQGHELTQKVHTLAEQLYSRA